MEQINIKLFSLVLEATGASFSPRIYSKIRGIVCRCSSSYNNWDDSDLDVDRPRSGKSGWNFNKHDYEDDDYDFGGRPRYKSNRSRYQEGKSNYDRDGYGMGRSNYEREGYGMRRSNYERDGYGMGRSNFGRRDKFEMAGGQLSKVNWEDIKLKSFEKNFYSPSETVLNRYEEEITNFRNTHRLTLIGKDIPNPLFEFSDYEFPPEVKETFSHKGFDKPTPIQAQGWPIVLSGKDFIGIGQTGSGKTLGFTVPGLIHIKHQPEVREEEGPVGLVLAPTRELVQQIHEVSEHMFGAARLGTACLYGGASKNVQAGILSRKPSFCIATPGRLLDFLEMGVTNLRNCTYLVLDEADRMLDMGFEPQIRKIVGQVRPDRQTLMWSATWPDEIRELASDFLLGDFIRLNVGSSDLYANPDIEQHVEVCEPFDKRNRFLEKMQEMAQDHQKILVFSQTKLQVDMLSRLLYRSGIKARGIHGDHSQANRNNTLDGFRSGRFQILVATDVASRGLDVDDITLVVNFDFPTDIEDYVHRIGRTARAGKSGTALSLVSDGDNAKAIKGLIELLKKGGHHIPSELYDLAGSKFYKKGYSRYRR